MRHRKITVVDICMVSGYSRDQLQATLKELPPYSSTPKKPRVAREFSAVDVITLCVIYVLENEYGIKRKMIQNISLLLKEALSGPKNLSPNARLIISFKPASVIFYSKDKDIPTESDGLYISLHQIFARAGHYLSYGTTSIEGLQHELLLAPVGITGNKRSG